MKGGIQIQLMSGLLEGFIMILTIIQWLEKSDRLSVCKQEAHKFDMEGSNLKKLIDVEVEQ
jgi:hypothetical protein